jgi:1-acyl-sn-glycerol-3-phosphate acyltransferase
MKTFAKIRFYWGAMVISLNTALLMIPTMMLFKRRKGVIIHYINRLTLKMMGGRVQAHGEMDLEADMYVMNHQGIIDIVAFEALQNNHLRWVAKKELFDAIWFGNLLKHGEMISLDRGNKSALVKLLKDVKRSKEELHRAVAIFPEGTRAKGQTLLPFKQGTKIVANKLGLKVQPIVITGSKWVLNEHEKSGHSGTVHYTFLPTIDVASAPKDWFEQLHTTMQKVIDDESLHHHRSR